jgi:hypothetical protein
VYCTWYCGEKEKEKKKAKHAVPVQYRTQEKDNEQKKYFRLPGLDSSAPVLFFFFHIYKK